MSSSTTTERVSDGPSADDVTDRLESVAERLERVAALLDQRATDYLKDINDDEAARSDQE